MGIVLGQELTRKGLLLGALILGVVAAGCGDSTPGVTNDPPPKGGPPKSDRHPPGLTQSQLNDSRR